MTLLDALLLYLHLLNICTLFYISVRTNHTLVRYLLYCAVFMHENTCYLAAHTVPQSSNTQSMTKPVDLSHISTPDVQSTISSRSPVLVSEPTPKSPASEQKGSTDLALDVDTLKERQVLAAQQSDAAPQRTEHMHPAKHRDQHQPSPPAAMPAATDIELQPYQSVGGEYTSFDTDSLYTGITPLLSPPQQRILDSVPNGAVCCVQPPPVPHHTTLAQRYLPTAVQYTSALTQSQANNYTQYIQPYALPIQQYQHHIRRTGDAVSISPEPSSPTAKRSIDPRINKLKLMDVELYPHSVTDTLAPANTDNITAYRQYRQYQPAQPIYIMEHGASTSTSSSSSSSTGSDETAGSPMLIARQQSRQQSSDGSTCSYRRQYGSPVYEPVRTSMSSDVIHSDVSTQAGGVLVRMHPASKHCKTQYSPRMKVASLTQRQPTTSTAEIPPLQLPEMLAGPSPAIEQYKTRSLMDIQSMYADIQQHQPAAPSTSIQTIIQRQPRSKSEEVVRLLTDRIAARTVRNRATSIRRTTSADTYIAAVKAHTKHKSMMCPYILHSVSCPYGITCKYCHSFDDVTPIKYDTKYKTKPCIEYHKLGQCRYKDRCKYLHNERRVHVGEVQTVLVDHDNHIISVDYNCK